MEKLNKSIKDYKGGSNLSIWIVIMLIFIPSSILTLSYIFVGYLVQDTIPALLLFFLLAMLLLFPVQLIVVLTANKKEHEKYSLTHALIISLHVYEGLKIIS